MTCCNKDDPILKSDNQDEVSVTPHKRSYQTVCAAKTLMLSLWDEKENVTLGIDLWTKELTVGEMNVHYHQMLLKMADTFERATRNTEAANLLRDFSSEFAKKLELKNDKQNG